METYPVIINGESCGEMSVSRDGLMTIFHVTMELREGVTRLSVYGDGAEGYLGVAMPENGELHLRKAVSAAGLRAFPKEIRCVSLAGLSAEACCGTGAEPASEPSEAEAQPEPEPESKPEQDGGAPGDDGGLLWFSTQDGVLTAFDGQRSLVAVPSDAPGAPSGIRRIIGGREYVVFPGKAGHK